MKYHQYIMSKRWHWRKMMLYMKRGKKCENCGATCNLEVHHLTYENLGDEKDGDLKILCTKCHGVESVMSRIMKRYLEGVR